jgi:hypothetical protein
MIFKYVLLFFMATSSQLSAVESENNDHVMTETTFRKGQQMKSIEGLRHRHSMKSLEHSIQDYSLKSFEAVGKKLPLVRHEIINGTAYEHSLCIMTKVQSLSEFNGCNFIEWIEYHLLMGVSHFYINNDCSTDKVFVQALKYYKKLGVLTVPNERSHRNCSDSKPNESLLLQKTFHRFAKNSCEWVTMIDMDEFLTLLPKKPDSLLEMLSYSQFPFIRLSWWNIGSEGHETRPKGKFCERKCRFVSAHSP